MGTFREISQERRVALAKQGKAIPRRNADGEITDGSYPIEDRADLQNAIQAVGRAAQGEQETVRRHIRKMARQLGATDLIPDTWAEADLQSLYYADATIQNDGLSAPFEVLRVGKFSHPGSGDQEITPAKLDQAVANFDALTARGAEFPIDYDHSFAEGGSSKAAGWIKELFRKGASLFARAKWTPDAARQIGEEEYRFFSAEFSDDWKDETGERHGFTVLAGGLTNRPFLKGMTPVALSDRIEAEEVRFLVPAVPVNPARGGETPPEVADKPTPETKEDEVTLTESSVLEALEGGKLTFSDEAKGKLAEALELKPDPKAEERNTTLAEANRTLTERVDRLDSELLAERRDRDLERARREGRIDATEETTSKWHERYTKFGREDAKALLFEMPAETIPVSERGSGKGAPEAEAAPEGVDPEAHELHRKVEAYMAANDGVSYSDALDKVA